MITSETLGDTILGGSENLGGTWLEEVGYWKYRLPPFPVSQESLDRPLPPSLGFLSRATSATNFCLTMSKAPWTKLAETRNLNKPLLFKLSCKGDKKDSPDSHTLRGSHSGPRHNGLDDSSDSVVQMESPGGRFMQQCANAIPRPQSWILTTASGPTVVKIPP